MRQTTALTFVAAALLGGLTLSAPRAAGQAKKKAAGNANAPASIEFSDEAVTAAIKKGVEFLKGIQKDDGSWGPHGEGGGGGYPVGPSAMVTYALLESGECRFDEAFMKKALDFLEKWQAPKRLTGQTPAKVDDNYKRSWGQFCHKTYSLGLRANAFLAATKQGARQYRKNLREDAEILIRSTKDGSYGYDCFGQTRSSGDNSNSQYGVLGVWAAAQADEEVPRGYWYAILKHWMDAANSDGGWAYRADRSASTATMTTAGLATLFVCYDNLLAEGFVKCDQGPKTQAVLRPLTRGLAWLDDYYQKTQGGVSAGAGHGGRGFYLLYGIERVGLASGYKYFGKADWYRLGATWLINHQNKDGSWPGGYGPPISTSYALLFLVRGRHAVLFNKLEFDGDWNNRPRDLASLCRWTSKQFETTVNWQIINLLVPPEEWHDAPIVYISGSTAPKMTPEHVAALRRYVLQGGTILSCAECEGKGFSEGIRKVYEKMFPQYKLTAVPADSKLYSINFKMDGYPDFQMVHNGIRPLIVHTDKDLPRAWQLQQTQTEKKDFQAPVNVAMYVSGKGLAEKALAARGTKFWPAEVKITPERTAKLARLKYNNRQGTEGNYDPEPLAWERFGRLMAQQVKTHVDVVGPIAIAELAASGAKLAVLSGTDAMGLSDEEVKILTQFVRDDGLLLMEAAGGAWPDGQAKAFNESAETLAMQIGTALGDQVVPTNRLRGLTITTPIYQQEGAKIDRVTYRRFSRVDQGLKEDTPRLRALLNSAGKPLVFVSSEDLSAALVGYDCYEVHGYSPTSAFELMRNLVLSKATPVAKPQPVPANTPGKKAATKK